MILSGHSFTKETLLARSEVQRIHADIGRLELDRLNGSPGCDWHETPWGKKMLLRLDTLVAIIENNVTQARQAEKEMVEEIVELWMKKNKPGVSLLPWQKQYFQLMVAGLDHDADTLIARQPMASGRTFVKNIVAEYMKDMRKQ